MNILNFRGKIFAPSPHPHAWPVFLLSWKYEILKKKISVTKRGGGTITRLGEGGGNVCYYVGERAVPSEELAVTSRDSYVTM